MAVSGITKDEDRLSAIGEGLAHQFSPVFVFHREESYFPIAVPDFIASGELRNIHNDSVAPEEWNNDKWVSLRIVPSKEAIHGDPRTAPMYCVVTRRRACYVLQYYVFYGMNGKYRCLCCCCCNIGLHYGDLEYVTIKVSRQNHKVLSVYMSRGDGGYLADFNELDRLDGTSRPIIYVAKNNHNMYSKPGRWIRTCGLKNDYTEQRQPGVNVWDPRIEHINELTWWNQFVGDLGKVPTPFHSTSWRGGNETHISRWRRWFCC